MPLDKAASALRRLLFYTGMAWGSGAFLVMPGPPSPLLAVGFAAVPGLALSLLLGQQGHSLYRPGDTGHRQRSLSGSLRPLGRHGHSGNRSG